MLNGLHVQKSTFTFVIHIPAYTVHNSPVCVVLFPKRKK